MDETQANHLKQNMDKESPMSLNVPPKLRADVAKAAKLTGTSRSGFVRAALAQATAETIAGRAAITEGKLQPKAA